MRSTGIPGGKGRELVPPPLGGSVCYVSFFVHFRFPLPNCAQTVSGWTTARSSLRKPSSSC